MLFTKPQSRIFTFIIYATLVLTFASLVDANAHDHINHKRLLKKRAPLPQVIGPGSAITESSSLAVPTSASQTTRSSSSVSSLTNSASSSSITSTSSTASASSTSTTSSSSTTISSTVSSTSSVTPSTTSSSIAPVLEKTTSLPTTAAPLSTTQSTVTMTQTSSASEPSSLDSQNPNSTSTKRTTITVIIIIASSVGGLAILWTIFRKWKLARSSKFDERLQPIDWQPTTDDDVIPNRGRPNSIASSFHSSGHNAVPGYGVHRSASDQGHGGYSGNSGHGHGNSDHGHGMTPLPDHDFTALPSTLAPVGGYADLARGPSPQLQMQETFNHGPAIHRPLYDANVPLHHQTGYGAHDAYDYNGRSMRF